VSRRDVRAGAVLAGLLAAGAPAGATPAMAVTGYPSAQTITFRTVPAIAGVRVRGGGRTVRTDARGLVTLTVTRTGPAFRAIEPPEVLTTRLASGREVRFGGFFDSGRTLGLSIYARARLRFVDPQGRRVAPAAIATVRLRSSTGRMVRMRGSVTPMLEATRVTRAPRGARSIGVQYAVESVRIDGDEVVHRARHRLLLARTRRLRVPLLLYSARFTATDALTRRPAGSAVLLEYASGRRVRIPLQDGTASVTGLPRGSYRARLVAPGYSVELPIWLSRDQAVNLQVVSKLDVALLLGGIVSLALGLLLVGRPRLRGRVRRIAAWPRRAGGVDASATEDQDPRRRGRPLRAARAGGRRNQPGGDGGAVP
jgi:hypothetical protein